MIKLLVLRVVLAQFQLVGLWVWFFGWHTFVCMSLRDGFSGTTGPIKSFQTRQADGLRHVVVLLLK